MNMFKKRPSNLLFKNSSVESEYDGLDDGLKSLLGEIQTPATLTSGRRSLAENTAVGGAPNSFHMTGQAADFRRDEVTPEMLKLFQGKGYKALDEGDHYHVEPAGKASQSSEGPLGTSSQPYKPQYPSDEDLGLTRPEEKKTSLFGKIMKYAAPAAIGAISGLGAVPGFIGGYAGIQSAEAEEQAQKMKDYQEEKKTRAKFLEPTGDQKLFEYYKSLNPDEQSQFSDLKNPPKDDSMTEYQRALLSLKSSESADKDKPDPKTVKKDEATLRKEFIGNPISKHHETSKTGLQKMENTMKSNNPSGFDDMSLIFNFMRTLDPESVVREGEYRTAENNSSFLEKFGIAFNKIASGQRLSQDQRQKLLMAARTQHAAHEQTFGKFAKDYQGIAKDYGVSAKNVLPGWKPYPEKIDTFYGKQLPIEESRMTPEDREAIDWLYENPNDPDAPMVQQMLKSKAILK